MDPLTASYPYYTPYSFSGNRVIDMVELEGLEPVPIGFGSNLVQGLELTGASDVEIAQSVERVGKIGVATGLLVFLAADIYFGAPISRFLIIEGVESIAEELSGIPIIPVFPDPTDLLDPIINKAIRKKLSNYPVTDPGLEKGLSKSVTSIERTSKHFVRSKRIWGGSIDITKGKTTTVLGRNLDGFGLDQVRAKGLHRQGQNTGGYNMLTQGPPDMVDGVKFDWANASHRQHYWDNLNKPWLDEAIGRGDVIKLADKPTVANMYEGGVEAVENLNFFGREVKYLESKGYTFENGNAIPPSSGN